MIKYLIAFVLFTPLVGVLFMELGAFSFAAQQTGYYNGSTLAYLFYILAFYLSYLFVKQHPVSFIKKKKENLHFKSIAYTAIVINLIALIILLFPFGAYKIWLGLVDKGSFRTNLGFFGSVAYFMLKSLVPAMLVLVSFVYLNSSKHSKRDQLLVFLNFFIAFLFGASWGFKSTALFILLPSFIILFWKIDTLKFIKFAALTFIIFLVFAGIFDNKSLKFDDINILKTHGGGNAIESTLYRLTVLQGDVCWKIWDLHINDQLESVKYYKTLISLIGDKNLNLLAGVNQNNYPEFITYHFGLLITYLCGNSPEAISKGYNVTGTVFSEGIVAGGFGGLLFFSVFAGLLTGLNRNLILEGLYKNNPIITCIAASFFCFQTFSWLNGGGVSALFHISIILGFFVTYIFLVSIITISKILIK